MSNQEEINKDVELEPGQVYTEPPPNLNPPDKEPPIEPPDSDEGDPQGPGR